MRHFLSIMLIAAVIDLPVTQAATKPTATPIQHLVVIFQENVSFDHYFATYPVAANPQGEPQFTAAPNTPTVNGLSGSLLTANPNLNPANNSGAANPFRFDRSQAFTSDMDHSYKAEQQAFDNGLMDLFPTYTGVHGPPPLPPPDVVATDGVVMGYFDGNTVTALWNYAQHYAMSDNSFGVTFGPSAIGAINLVSGQTNGVTTDINGSGSTVSDGNGGLTLIDDAEPYLDVCSDSTSEQARLSGKNIGDLLNAAGITWGWFQGGFDLTATNPDLTSGCGRGSTSTLGTGASAEDYIPHHEPFQYYASTANSQHARPSSLSLLGQTADAANHQYDVKDFFTAVQTGQFPAVSFIKAPGYENGHAGYSDPLDEQMFVVRIINYIQTRPEWANTAIIIAYDDSDGWYDHQASQIVNPSTSSEDALNGPGVCGTGDALPGVDPAAQHAQGRCGFGPRLPLLVISPWAKVNFVDHTLTSQASIIRFIEDNWLGGQRIGQGSFDSITNSITNMFDFTAPSAGKLFLAGDTGLPIQ